MVRDPPYKALALLAPLVAVCGIALSILLWQALNAAQDRNIQSILETRLNAFAKLTTARVEEVQDTLARTGRRWTVLQRTPRLAWATDAQGILGDFPELDNVRWIDAQMVLRWSVSRQGEEWALNTPIPSDNFAVQTFSGTPSDNAARMTNFAVDDKGVLRADIYVPLWINGVFDGVTAGHVNLTQMLAVASDDSKSMSAIEVSYNGRSIFSHDVAPQGRGNDYRTRTDLVLNGLSLQIEMSPTESFLNGTLSPWPSIVLAAWLLSTLLVTLLIRQWSITVRAYGEIQRTQTALRHKEDEAQGRRVQLETTYSAAPFGLCFFDLQMRYLDINERLAIQNGHTVQEHIGRTPRELGIPIADDIEAMFGYVIKTGQPIENMELAGPDREHPNGVRHWLNSYHPARDGNGKMIGVVASALDITSLKEAEIEKNALADQLHQSQKTEALGRLTGGVAHDFNNMLGVILGTLEFVAEKSTDATLTPLIARIRGAAERAGDLVQRLSAFARQQPLNPRTVNAAELIQNLARLLTRSIEAQIDIRCVTPDDLWHVEVDPSQLEAAILNLVLNARDAMPQGGKLTIEASNVAFSEDDAALQPDLAVGEYVAISISDTGTGMSPDIIAKVFEPFFTTKAVGRGSGLGLSMVHGFIKQSRGHIQIYSELGVGTVMKLYVPRAYGDLAADDTELAEKPAGRSEVILIVEDDDMVRETAVELLQTLGYHTLTARSGVEALPILESDQHIDVLFTDIVMPGGIDGAVLAKKALVMRPSLPVVFASGYTDNAIGHQGLLPAHTIFVQKPYRGSDLAKKIRSALDGAGQLGSNSSTSNPSTSNS